MKMHVAVDEVIGITTDVVYGPANEHDITRAREVIPETRKLFMGMRDMLGSHSVMNFKISQELTI